MRLLKAVCGVVLGVGLVSAAQAATGYCNTFSPLTTGGISVTDFVYRGSNATNCYGVVGANDSATAVSGLFGKASSDDWQFLAKYDADPNGSETGSFNLVPPLSGSISFELVYFGLSGGFHEYGLKAEASPLTLLPATMDLMGVIKQGAAASGGGFAAYFFNDVLVETDGTGTLNFGKFKTTFGPGTNDFSHFSIYGSDYKDVKRPPDEIPEPAPIALMGLALAGFAVARRRAKAKSGN